MDARERVRRQVVEAFFDGGAYGKDECKQWLDDLLYLPTEANEKVVKAQVREGMEELQMEEEIVFVGWDEKQIDVTMADLAVPKELAEADDEDAEEEQKIIR